MSKTVCNDCKCESYPSCVVKCRNGEYDCCDNCIDGASGFHKKLASDGVGICDVPEDYILCDVCDEFYNPEEEEEHLEECEKRDYVTCKTCGESYDPEEEEEHLEDCE